MLVAKLSKIKLLFVSKETESLAKLSKFIDLQNKRVPNSAELEATRVNSARSDVCSDHHLSPVIQLMYTRSGEIAA